MCPRTLPNPSESNVMKKYNGILIHTDPTLEKRFVWYLCLSAKIGELSMLSTSICLLTRCEEKKNSDLHFSITFNSERVRGSSWARITSESHVLAMYGTFRAIPCDPRALNLRKSEIY